jgi:pyridoxamine 5'-phosphate oxidase
MNRDISALRENYQMATLDIEDLKESPIDQFKIWLHDAIDGELPEPTAFVLSTVDDKGNPSSRTVLLKEVNDVGFVFYTNYWSFKAQQIEANPKVAITFLWLGLQRQVRIIGHAMKVDKAITKEYFLSRPKESQIGAWASPQSQTIADRFYLENRFEEFKNKFENLEEIPVPDHWGGYEITPIEIEFWQGRQSRLHDRMQYTRNDDYSWKIERLAP